MKVYIGPYKKWITSDKFGSYMNKKYSFDWPSKANRTSYENFLDFFDEKLNWFYRKTINRIFDSIERNITVRIDDYDVWSADYTLALVILPVLKKIKEAKQGTPYVNFEDVPKELRPSAKEKKKLAIDGSMDEYFEKRWDYILDEMIFAFEHILDDSWEDEFYSGEFDIKLIPTDNDYNEVSEDDATLYKMENGPNHTSVFDKEGFEKASKRIDNGLILFGKYYRALWT